MILEHGVSDDDATVWVVVLWFEFDLVFVICDLCCVWIFVWGFVLFRLGDLLYLLMVLSVLKRISDEDCQLLGFNPKYARPDRMILQVLPIPPQIARPSIMMDTSSRSEASFFLHCVYVFSVFTSHTSLFI